MGRTVWRGYTTNDADPIPEREREREKEKVYGIMKEKENERGDLL